MYPTEIENARPEKLHTRIFIAALKSHICQDSARGRKAVQDTS